MTDREDIQEVVDDLDIDIDLDSYTEEELPEVETETHGRTEVVEISKIVPYHPEKDDQAPQDVTRNIEVSPSKQIFLQLEFRPECPTCGYIPHGDDETLTMIGECHQSGAKLCTSCVSQCESCGVMMSPQHTTGNPLDNHTYCHSCWEQMNHEIEFQRKIEEKEQERKDEKQRAELERQKREMERKERRRKREEKRKDWKVMLQIAEQMSKQKQRKHEQGKLENQPKPFDKAQKRYDKARDRIQNMRDNTRG